jgi:hypothetical protein
MPEAQYKEIRFTDDDIVDIDEWIPEGEYNPHNVRPWLLHDHGFVLAVVFADCLQDALDIAVDNNKLDNFMVSYDELESDYTQDTDGEYIGVDYLGNASEPFDIQNVSAIELPNAKMSFCKLFTE